VIRAPDKSVIIYGQPKQGVVVRFVDKSAKQDAEVLLSHFIPSGDADRE
jgi:uncharacterized protein (UPF0218 family)